MAFNLPPRPGTFNSGIPISDPSSSTSFVPGLNPARNLYNRFWAWREQLALPNPGNAENLQKEVKGKHIPCNNLFLKCLDPSANSYAAHKLHVRRC